MADIFISYAREDRERARELAEALEGRGWSVFWDREIPIGSTWAQHIGAELEAARCVVVGWSAAAAESRWVRQEAEEGRERGILIPVLFEEVKPPLGFRDIQTADLSSWDGNPEAEVYRLLALAIDGILGSAEEVPENPTLKDIRLRLVEGPDWQVLEGLLYDLERFERDHPGHPETRLLGRQVSEALKAARPPLPPPMAEVCPGSEPGRPWFRTWRLAAAILGLVAVLVLVGWAVWKSRQPAAIEPAAVEEHGWSQQPEKEPAAVYAVQTGKEPSAQLPLPVPVGTEEGTLVLNALPWAKVTEIIDDRGKSVATGQEPYTPLMRILPTGTYGITLAQQGGLVLAATTVVKTIEVRITTEVVTTTFVTLDVGSDAYSEDYLRRELPQPIRLGPPETLREAAKTYFDGDFLRTLEILEQASFANERATVLAHLFRAAARHALFRITGREDDELLQEAAADARACRRLDADLVPDPEVFSPAFVSFFRSSLEFP